MSVKEQIIDCMEAVPEDELPVILSVVRHFAVEDELATPEDIAAYEQAMAEYRAGELVPIRAIR